MAAEWNLFHSSCSPSGANLQRKLKIRNTIHSNHRIWCKAKISYKPEKEMKTVANCEGWWQPTRLFSGWALVKESGSFCLAHTGFLVLKEAVADWSSVLHSWVTGLIVMWPVSFGFLSSYCIPSACLLHVPSSPLPERGDQETQRTASREREALRVILLVSFSAGYRIDFEGQIMAQGRVKTQRLSYFSLTSPWRFPFPAGTHRNGTAQAPVNALLCRLAGRLSLLLLCPRLLPREPGHRERTSAGRSPLLSAVL